MTGNAHERGWEKLRQLDGEGVIEGLTGIAPDVGRYVIEFGFGELYSRPGLNPKTKEIAAVAAIEERLGTITPTDPRS